MKRVWLSLCVMALLAFMPALAHAETNSKFDQPTVQASPATNTNALTTDTSPLAPLGISLLGVALMGATKKVDLTRTYLFGGDSYGPGKDIVVPEDFPDIDGETGDVIHEDGSPAARNAARARSFSTAPNTGGVNTGESGAHEGKSATATVSGKTKAELEDMTVADLDALAVELGIPVDRKEGEGDPLKSDYVRVLGKKAKE